MWQWLGSLDVRRQDDGADFPRSDWNHPGDDESEDTPSASPTPATQGLSATHELLSPEQELRLASRLEEAIERLRECIDEEPDALDWWMRRVSDDPASLVPEAHPAPLDDLITAFDTWQVLHHLQQQHPADQLADEAMAARRALSDRLRDLTPPREAFLEMIQALIADLAPAASVRVRRALLRVQALRNEFVHYNVRLVHYVARRYQGRNVDFDDLVQEGILGLLRATLKFDAGAGVRFSTYAYWWILQAIQSAVTQQRSLIRLPGLVSQQFHQLHAWRQRFRNEVGRWPTAGETRRETGLDESTQTDLLSLSNQCISADTPLYGDSTRTLLDELESHDSIRPPDEEVETLERSRCLKDLLTRLPERDARVLTLRFGLDGGQEFTLREVAALLKISPERVRQIEKEAIVKLRAQGLEGF